jgi:1A family penicillin-binding protein
MPNVHWQEIWKKRLQQLNQQKFSPGQPVLNPPPPLPRPKFLSQLKVTWYDLWHPRGKVEMMTGYMPGKKMDKSKLLAFFTFCAFLLVSFGAIAGSVLLVVVAKDLPRPDRIVRREGFATKIYDRNAKLIYDVFEKQKRTPVQLYEIPEHLRKATIAIEDKDFYFHKGFDPRGYLRAVYNILIRHRLQGGSTLTQQLVKNVLLSSERTISRKVKEFILTLEIESRYSKDQILQMYLNEAPYGGTAWGVEEAARTYFDKSASELSLTESAFLAGLPQSPSRYSPFGQTPDAYVGRTKDVLRRMREEDYISAEGEKKSLDELSGLKFNSAGGTLKAPHFVMYVKGLLEEKYGEKMVEQGGLRVTTSLDLDLQEKAQEIVTTEIAKVEKLHITNGAAIVLNPQTGEILSMVGSKNYDDPNYDGKFNVVTSKNRQPGSSIKPVTYVTALKKGYTASTLLMDTTTVFPGGDKPEYVPVNYDGKEHGPLQMRFALGNSINIAAVKMLATVGVKEMLTTAYDMGISTLEPTPENMRRLGLSVTLGGGEVSLLDMASAYSAFANTGLRVEPTAILKVTDKDGNVLEEVHPLPGRRVLSEGEAFIISNILSDNKSRLLTFGENNLLKFTNREVAAKTGTTNNRRDNWTIGWTPQVIVGTWVGNNDNTEMKALVSGVSGAAPIWRKIINEYLKDKPVENFSIPSGVVTADVDIVSGYRAHDGFPLRTEFFIRGTEPVGEDPVHQKLKICKAQGKLATPVDVARGDYDEKEFFTFKEKDPFAASDQINRWQKGIDDWANKQTDGRYHPPTEYCSTMDEVYIRFLAPQDQTQVDSSFSVKVEPVTVNEVVKVEIFVDGASKQTFTSPPYELGMTLPDGKYTLRAEVTDSKGNHGSQESRIGVKVPWDYEPSPMPTPTAILTTSPTPP